MITSEILRILFGLVAVLGLIGLFAVAARKMGLISASGGLVRKRRLAIVETLAVDARRRMVIVKCDGKEHLVMLGAGSETVIERGLEGAPEAEEEIAPQANPFAGLRKALETKLRPAGQTVSKTAA